jgi:hypothetical protein
MTITDKFLNTIALSDLYNQAYKLHVRRALECGGRIEDLDNLVVIESRVGKNLQNAISCRKMAMELQKPITD